MNDCLWSWIYACENCPGNSLNQPCYLSVNTGDEELVRQIREEYQRDVDEALEPVKSKWRRRFQEMKTGDER